MLWACLGNVLSYNSKQWDCDPHTWPLGKGKFYSDLTFGMVCKLLYTPEVVRNGFGFDFPKLRLVTANTDAVMGVLW